MSEQNNCVDNDWLVFYKWRGQVYSLKIKACSQEEAEDKAVNYLIQHGKATNCKIISVVLAESS